MTDRLKILVALKDEDEAFMFSKALNAAGFDLKSAKDGSRALELAINEHPALIIADLDLPGINAERLSSILKHNPYTSKMPFLYISESIFEIKGFASGIDMFLKRPLNIEEMVSRVVQRLASKGAGSKEIEGRLKHMSLADMLQFLHLNKKEGELRITNGEQAGTVFVKGGEVYNAVLDGVEKEKALYRLLSWRDGKFEFIPGAVKAQRKVSATASNLLMEGMRQLDEFRKKEDLFPDRKTVLRPKVNAEALPKGLQPVIYDVMRLVRLYPVVEELVDKAAYTDYEVYQTLLTLISKGVLEADKPAAPAGAGFLTNDQMISIREKIINRFTDTRNIDYGKIFLMATSASLARTFIRHCRRVPGFTASQKSVLSEMSPAYPLGEIARLRLYGGMDIIIFAVPSARDMAPLWRAFSTNLAGLMLLWDADGTAELKGLAETKRELLAMRRIPTAHILAGRKGSGIEDECRKELGLRLDEHIFFFDPEDGEAVFEPFYSIFGNLLKDDYISKR